MGCVVIDFRFVVNIEPLKHRLMMLTINVKCKFWTVVFNDAFASKTVACSSLPVGKTERDIKAAVLLGNK